MSNVKKYEKSHEDIIMLQPESTLQLAIFDVYKYNEKKNCLVSMEKRD